jgi:hypothetical protein
MTHDMVADYHPLLFIGCFAYLLYLQWELMLYSLLLFPVALLKPLGEVPNHKLLDELQVVVDPRQYVAGVLLF